MTDPTPDRPDADELDDEQLDAVAGGASIDWSAPEDWRRAEDERAKRPRLSMDNPW